MAKNFFYIIIKNNIILFNNINNRAGRVVRLVRLIRLVKLYKAASAEQPKKKSIKDLLEERRKKKQSNLVYPDGTNNNLLTQNPQGINSNNLNAPPSPRNRGGSKQFEDPINLNQRPSKAIIQMD